MGAVDPNMPVLLVDEYKTMIRALRKLMKQLGFENVDEASGAKQALEMLRSQPYSLVISDLELAPMSGLDLLREVRSDDDLSRVAFVVIAADDKNGNASDAKAAGASDYIVKPFNAASLKLRLTTILGRS